ncbi:hypothetical protein IWQ60_005087 [Tieghemiomyces parasiticus]|uniref:peptidylprolyl isomerase n=1 Tax=Tieghemiomyces parasiticus TaxID=78921 RepID=A0A9W8DZ67_9FUNG|nr:hypothetical protein IWQ60_005087 [Tieghemiomyces parasiticus]
MPGFFNRQTVTLLLTGVLIFFSFRYLLFTPDQKPSVPQPPSPSTVMGVTRKVIQAGTGPRPQTGQKVDMLYTGKLTDGTVFDSTAKRNNQPFSFTVGVGQVIRGWDEGVPQMNVGEKAELTISPDYGYGASGVGKIIPANAVLIFEVELLKIH